MSFNITLCLSNIATKTCVCVFVCVCVCVFVKTAPKLNEEEIIQKLLFWCCLEVRDKQTHEKPSSGQTLSHRCAKKPHYALLTPGIPIGTPK